MVRAGIVSTMAWTISIVSVQQPDVTAVKVYRPQDLTLKVHLTRIAPCPEQFPAGYFWYGGKYTGPGHPPRCVKKLLSADCIEEPKVKTATEHEPPVRTVQELQCMDNNPEDGELTSPLHSMTKSIASRRSLRLFASETLVDMNSEDG